MEKEKDQKKSKELISLNSKILEVVKIDELEERLELEAPWISLCPCKFAQGVEW